MAVVTSRRKRSRAQSTLADLEGPAFCGTAPPLALTHKLDQLCTMGKPTPEPSANAKPRTRVYDDAFDLRRAKSSCKTSTKNTSAAAPDLDQEHSCGVCVSPRL